MAVCYVVHVYSPRGRWVNSLNATAETLPRVLAGIKQGFTTRIKERRCP